MKHGYLLLLAAGCGFKSSAGMDVPVPDGGVSGSWVFDTAADFAAAGYAIKDMTIEVRGSLTPNAYTYGGLVAHGLQGMALWGNGDTSWTKLDGKMPSGAGLWGGEALPDMSVLQHFGITNKNSMTVWFEGEVWLASGSNEMFRVVGNNVAFLDIARPGTTTYVRVAENATKPVETPESGWYPVRIGFANADVGSNFEFTHSESGGALVPWTRDRLRARTSP